MLRNGPEKREQIRETLRYFKEHQVSQCVLYIDRCILTVDHILIHTHNSGPAPRGGPAQAGHRSRTGLCGNLLVGGPRAALRGAARRGEGAGAHPEPAVGVTICHTSRTRTHSMPRAYAHIDLKRAKAHAANVDAPGGQQEVAQTPVT